MCPCMLHSRTNHLVEFRSYLLLEVVEFAHLICTYVFKHTSLKCRAPKIISECWAEVIHGQKDTWCNSEVVKTGSV